MQRATNLLMMAAFGVRTANIVPGLGHFPSVVYTSCILEDLVTCNFFKTIVHSCWFPSDEKGSKQNHGVTACCVMLEVHRLLEFASGLKADDPLTADLGLK